MRVVFTLIFVVAFVLEVGGLVYLGSGSLSERLGLLFQVLAFYGIGLGFFARALKDFAGIVDDMTSPNALGFLRGNAMFLALVFGIGGVGLGTKRRQGSHALGCLGQLILGITFPAQVLYAAFHILVLMPAAYVGYSFTSGLVEAVVGSGQDVDFVLTSADTGEEKERMSASRLFSADRVAAKTFMLGLPAAVFVLVLKIVGIFGG